MTNCTEAHEYYQELEREKILAMQPGPELNALVAEKVMGWEWNDEKTFTSDNYIKVEPAYAFNHESGEPYFNWSPSTDISVAWEVVKVLSKKYGVNVYEDDGAPCECTLVQYPETVAVAEGKTAPEAICKAVLLACMEVE